jgi:hypothetical protein
MYLTWGLALSSLIAPPRTQAWQNSGITWNNDAATFISTTSFPAGTVWRDDLLVGVTQWNDMLGMHFEFDPLGDDTDGTHGLGNGTNEIVFTDNAGTGGALAVTSIRFRGSDIEEADIAFNNSVTWETGAHDPRVVETTASFRFTAVHELGHFIGLDHEDNQMAALLTSASGFFGGAENTRARGFPDDAIGSRTLYPFANRETDIAISNFRWLSSNATSLILPTSTFAAPPGGTFTTGFAFGNLGTETVGTFDWIIVLSSNDIISTSDRIIGSGTGWGTAGFYGSSTFVVGVPADMPPGEYFVGAILDPNNRVAEQREANNRVAFPGKLRVR